MATEDLVINQYNIAKQYFQKLNSPKKIDLGWEIDGEIDVIDDEGSYWDTYKVKIIFPEKFPEKLFELYEVGGKIPKEPDWHNSSSCCLSTNAIIYSELGDDLNLLNWLSKFAHPFLANHVYRLKTKKYANGEFKHYTAGIIQGYEKLFDLSGVRSVFHRLKGMCHILNDRNAKCFCNSGKKIKNCYLISPNTHRLFNIPVHVLTSDLYEIAKYMNAK